MHPLDNPIWRALTTRQAHLGASDRGASKFHDDVSILGGLADAGPESYAALARLLAPGARVGMFLAEPIAAPDFELVSSAPLLQMVREDGAPPAVRRGPAIVALGAPDVAAMLALTELAKPGPFNARTHEMGDYFGILGDDGALVAMAGERLRVPGYTELSAICTHPDHLGRGHAAALTAHGIERILARGEQPLLHVRPENERAVALYERLGFTKRLHSRYVILSRT